MTKQTFKWLIGIIITLIILNLASLGFILYKSLNAPVFQPLTGETVRPGGSARPFPEMMMNRLDFTDEQRTELISEFKSHREQMRMLNDSMQQIRVQLFTMNRSSSGEGDIERDQLYQRSGELHARMMRMQDQHIRSLLEISNQEQRQQLMRWLHRMGQRGMGNGPGAQERNMMHRERRGMN